MTEERETLGMKVADIFKNARVWILIFFVFISVVAVDYSFSSDGVVINGVVPASPAEKAGFEFNGNINIRSLEQIFSVNGQEISSIQQYYDILDSSEPNSTLRILTDKKYYSIIVPFGENKSVSDLVGLSVREEASSNIRLGIELEGGSRLILKTKDKLSESDFDLLVNTLQSRLDVYGASGTKVKKLEDSFSDDQFIVVESISSNKNDIFELIKRQGEFEAKIGNTSVFTGNNVVRVFNDPQHASLQGCSDTGSGQICSFAFSIEIDSEGAEKFFAKTSTLSVVGSQLSEEVSFHLDEKEITSLSIASSFKYQKISQPQITVSGNEAPDRDKAVKSAQREMKFLQTILSTQSLPTELDVVQSYSISSSLGQELLENATLVGFFALLVVAGIVALRYKHFSIFVGILIALVTEVIIVFGFASFMRVSMDLVAIGGLIAAIGTGVDDQIIITDEYFRKRKKSMSSKNKVKHAMLIIMIAYLTTIVAMTPFLASAALSLVKGFAFMIIAGVTIGVFVTRPAYAAMLRIFMTTRKERKEEEE